MEHLAPCLELTIAELLTTWPATMTVFLQRRMECVGCVMARFETVDEAAVNYAIPAPVLLAEIYAAIGAAGSADKP